MKPKITKDGKGLFPLLTDFLLSFFPGAKLYAFGSRTLNRDCRKCDFDFMLCFPGGYEQVVKFLQDNKLLNNPTWRKKVQSQTENRSLGVKAYAKMLFQLYVEEKRVETERYFRYTKDEFGNEVKIDIMISYADAALDTRLVKL